MDWREEFELLSSMLLKPGESCQIIGEKPCPIIKVIYNEFDLTFQLLQNYPETKPTIAMNSNVLDRKVCDEILETLSHEASTCLGDPMLFQLSQSAYEKVIERVEVLKDKENGEVEIEDLIVTLVEIDHMRNQVKYVKHLQTWTTQLDIKLFVVHLEFLSKHWLLIQSTEDQLKQFMKNLKTQNVDVDSKGKPCKERLSTILYTKSVKTPHVDNFNEETVKSKSELLSIFSRLKLEVIIAELKLSNEHVSLLL